MLVDQADILQYIPQRPPIVMVHWLLEATEDHAVTQLLVLPDNVFVAQHYLAEPGMIENIAQTAAVHVGYQCSLMGIPVPIGYIAAIKDLKVESLPKENTTITTTVTVLNKVLDITVVRGTIQQEGVTLCSCEMRIFAKLEPQ